jgi:hypothetical protein
MVSTAMLATNCKCASRALSVPCATPGVWARDNRTMRLRRMCVVSAAVDTADTTDETELAQRDSMEEYLELKQWLLKRTQRSAAFLTIYILLTIGDRVLLPRAVACALAFERCEAAVPAADVTDAQMCSVQPSTFTRVISLHLLHICRRPWASSHFG